VAMGHALMIHLALDSTAVSTGKGAQRHSPPADRLLRRIGVNAASRFNAVLGKKGIR